MLVLDFQALRWKSDTGSRSWMDRRGAAGSKRLSFRKTIPFGGNSLEVSILIYNNVGHFRGFPDFYGLIWMFST